MKASSITVVLTVLVAVLATIAAATGLYWGDGGASFPFTTLRGQTVQIFGQGLYRYDTVFYASGFKGQDLVVLSLGVPLLLMALMLSRRGSVPGLLLLEGILGYFLYIYSSMALGAVFNTLFLLYVIIVSASLFAFIQAFASVDFDIIASRISERLPVRSLAIFMFAAGSVTMFAWGLPLVAALMRGGTPERMDHYTTMVTFALDLAIITPSTFLCSDLVLKKEPLGYVISLPLLITIILLAPQIVLSTVFQRSAGVHFTTPEMVGPVAGFVILGLIAFRLLIKILRGVKAEEQ